MPTQTPPPCGSPRMGSSSQGVVAALVLGLWLAWRLACRRGRPRSFLWVDTDGGSDGDVRVWMDGAFDMMHFGHANAFRQGRACGTHLIVGVNDTESITACKGAPLMTNAERVAVVRSCRWVDEVVEAVPYVMDDKYVKETVIDDLSVDWVVHGDDPCVVDGRDVYEAARRLGRYRTIPRTEGISTTNLVERILRASPAAAAVLPVPPAALSDTSTAGPRSSGARSVPTSNLFLTASLLREYGAAVRSPRAASKVVYMDGAFDLFHAGHAEALAQARARGDLLLVGVHGDDIVRRTKGQGRPVMGLHERLLSVLGCRHVDDVLFDAPWTVTSEMIAALNIALVVRSRVEEEGTGAGAGAGAGTDADDAVARARFRYARSAGKYEELPDGEFAFLSVPAIVGRVQSREGQMANRVSRKLQAEAEYYSARYNPNIRGQPGQGLGQRPGPAVNEAGPDDA